MVNFSPNAGIFLLVKQSLVKSTPEIAVCDDVTQLQKFSKNIGLAHTAEKYIAFNIITLPNI